ALALDADRTRDPWPRRSLMLRAIAQFAAVEPGQEEYPQALYDRAHLLHEVGRREEALEFGRRYLAIDPGTAWAAALRRELRGSGLPPQPLQPVLGARLRDVEVGQPREVRDLRLHAAVDQSLQERTRRPPELEQRDALGRVHVPEPLRLADRRL